MEFSKSLKLNHLFRRLSQKGRSAANSSLVVYCRKNNLSENRIRRRLREIYRLHEAQFLPGWDIVVVARSRAVDAPYQKLERAYLSLADKLGLLRSAEEPASQAPRVEKP